MSTRSLISKEIGPDAYRTIYCHSGGDLSHNGALLIDYYNTPDRVDKLLDLGDISFLDKKLEHDPNEPHDICFEKNQRGVTVAYGRDAGKTETEAAIMTLAQLDTPKSYINFVYVFTKDKQWKYFRHGHSQEGLLDVKSDLEAEYGKLRRIKGYYGEIPRRLPKAIPVSEETKHYSGIVYSSIKFANLSNRAK